MNAGAVPVPEPLRASSDGTPLLYGTLCAYLQLEELDESDAPRLEEVNALVLDWFGGKLRFTGTSLFEEVQAFSPEDLELISCHPELLQRKAESEYGELDAELIEFESDQEAAPFEETEICFHGGDEPGLASPWQYRFFSVVLPYAQQRSLTRFRTASMLRIEVPAAWPLDDFAQRVLTIASKLRLRWGNAGLGLAGWENSQRNATSEAIYAVARRYPGYDTGDYFRGMIDWHEKVRTVSWLTLLGPALEERCAAGGRLEVLPGGVHAARVGASLVLRAGDAPRAGDANRRDVPAEYIAVDQLLQPVRAKSCETFAPPWTEETTNAWLDRFARALAQRLV